ncbi:hypothetical protein GcM1_190030 [Golovinomyces cichoracearum]|uniref:Uncharacterized protein n=1 Tax=Golovinomyces cichoracearum TaxID=62708 RepID=A0A420J1Z3_9PEZI|nr:hypothetical protein GcM1_190030 [Golovinomyces cichoracearum]
MYGYRSERSFSSDELESGIFVPYKDVVEQAEEEPRLDDSSSELPLPSYEPMHDYLRRQHALFKPTILIRATPMKIPTAISIQPVQTGHSMSTPPSLSLSSSRSHEPLLIDIFDVSTPPPSYDNIHHSQNEMEMQTFWGITGGLEGETSMEEQEDDDDDNLPIEDLVKWVVVMLMISLTIAFIGTLLDWGRI